MPTREFKKDILQLLLKMAAIFLGEGGGKWPNGDEETELGLRKKASRTVGKDRGKWGVGEFVLSLVNPCTHHFTKFETE